jgi:hypothetical protein
MLDSRLINVAQSDGREGPTMGLRLGLFAARGMSPSIRLGTNAVNEDHYIITQQPFYDPAPVARCLVNW